MANNIFLERRRKFTDQLQDNSFALLASGQAMHRTFDAFFKFCPNRHFYYLTGLARENFSLFLAKNNDTYLEYIFIEEPSDYATKWLGSRLTKEEVNDISGIDLKNIFYVEEFKSFIGDKIMTDSRQAILKSTPVYLYLDLFRYKKMHKPISFTYFSEVIDNYPELIIKDANQIISDMRRLKSNDEIEQIKQAVKYTKSGIESILKTTKPGMNERQLEALFEYQIRMVGSNGLAFDTIIANGKNATILHYVENDKLIEDGNLVLIDLGALSGLYAGDISRTFPANGNFTERQKQFYQLVLDVNKATIKRIKPGIYVRELNDFAKDMLADGMIKLNMIKEKSDISKYYYHGVSHYLGLDVHDVGTYMKPIEPGIVLTVEPGIYIEEEGIGIRIEDDILVTEDGYLNLSESIIKEISDIEDFMK